jgi:hypothetical protein
MHCGFSFSDQTVYKAHMLRHKRPKDELFFLQQQLGKLGESLEEEMMPAPIPIRPIKRIMFGEIGTASSNFVQIKSRRVKEETLSIRNTVKVGSECSAFTKVVPKYCESSCGSEYSQSPIKQEEWTCQELNR